MTKQKAPKNQDLSSSRFTLISLTALAALLARLGYLYLFSNTFLRDGIWSDAATYNQWARRIVTNHDWLGSDPFFMAPLYPYFLAAIYTVFGESLTVVRLVQAILGSGTAVFVFLIAERSFSSKKAGLAAGLLAGLYGPFLLSHNLLLVETLKVFLLSLATWFFLVARSEPKRIWWFYGGLAMGGAILCRASDLLLFFVVQVWILWLGGVSLRERFLQGGIVAAAVLLCILPVTIRNYLVSGEMILITSNGGLNFYLGNNSQAVGRYYNVDRLDLAVDPDGRVYLETTMNRELRPSEVSSIWFSRAMEFITNEPGSFLRLLARKASLFFHYKEISQLGYNYAFVEQTATGILKFLPTFLVVGPLGILGAVLMFGRWKELFLLYGFLLGEILSVVLFFVTDRFRLSAIPFFMVFGGMALVTLIDRVRSKTTSGLVAQVAILGSCIIFMTVLTEDIPDEFSLEWEQVGTLYFNAGNHSTALQAYRNAAAYRDSYHLRNRVGNVLLASGKIDEAITQFKAAHSMHPQQAASTFNIGTAYVARGEWDMALSTFNDALAINPRYADAHLNKGLTLYYLQRFPEALASLRRYTELEPDKAKLGSVYNDMRNLEQLIRQGSASPQR